MTARITWRAFAMATAPLILAAPLIALGVVPDSAAIAVITWAAVVLALNIHRSAAQ